MRQKLLTYLIVVCFAAWCIAILQNYVLEYARNTREKALENSAITESELFRALKISAESLEMLEEFAKNYDLDIAEVITYYMFVNDFDLLGDKLKVSDKQQYVQELSILKTESPDEWEEVYAAYAAIFSDVEYFPIPESSTEYPINISFANGWGNERYYDDVMHFHEGTDIIADHERGYVPVVSMTDGVVENIGWLELGGYRIGIRSEQGGYFYYAHLYNYSKNYKIGDTVKAGELIGFMGDSGYGRTEGTVGNFAVHLHMGIYIKTRNYEELSVNPFPVLSYMSKKRVLYNIQGK